LINVTELYSMSGIPFLLVDSFTNEPFRGNPAGVVLLDKPADATWMQAVAMEMNQAETAFISPQEGGFSLRWFTPTVEVDLCGHATLASAHVLWQTGRLPSSIPVRFHTRSGWLTCVRVSDEIEMDFPALASEAVNAPTGLFSALGIRKGEVFDNRMDFLVVVDGEQVVRSMRPEMAGLLVLPSRGVIVTAAAEAAQNYDFVSRFFAPQSGIPEDPVTGSTHCALGPFWSRRLKKNPVRGYQASARGGYVTVEVREDRVRLRGNAITVVSGELAAAPRTQQ
jgi:PhzF family phenazine biosynthesis protein